MDKEAVFWSAERDGKVRCVLCPRACSIAPGESGHCGARGNLDGVMRLPFWGKLSSIAIDPIEKKPLRRFMPGTSTFSAGFWGCNMDCPFCQNHEISHPGSRGGIEHAIDPETLVGMALRSGAPSISYTYSEPCIHMEYICACMEIARGAGLRNVLVTNGCIMPSPARRILGLCDAANVDLKTHSTYLYRSALGGSLEAVEEFIRTAASLCHLEVTTLVVPGISDSIAGMEEISTFLASVTPVPPLHITPYHPDFRMNAPAPGRSDYEQLAKVAKKILPGVFSY